MIRINLLPFRAARKKENIRQQIVFFLVILAITLVVLFFINGSLGNKVSALTEKVEETRTALLREEAKAKEVDRIQQQIDTLNKKLAVIGTLENNRTEALDFMTQMSQIIVAKRMWLTSIQNQMDTVNIAGKALDNKTVADYMTNLENSGLFASVDLDALQMETIKDIKMKSFSISCKKITPEETKE